eukprot:1155005-Amorphochlora_amoeboformis.AAC.1
MEIPEIHWRSTRTAVTSRHITLQNFPEDSSTNAHISTLSQASYSRSKQSNLLARPNYGLL